MKEDRDENPVCHTRNYRNIIENEFTQLSNLDCLPDSFSRLENPLIQSIMDFNPDRGDSESITSPKNTPKSRIPVRAKTKKVGKSEAQCKSEILEKQIELTSMLEDEKHKRFRAEEKNMKKEHELSIAENRIQDLEKETLILKEQSETLKKALLAKKLEVEKVNRERDEALHRIGEHELKLGVKNNFACNNLHDMHVSGWGKVGLISNWLSSTSEASDQQKADLINNFLTQFFRQSK